MAPWAELLGEQIQTKDGLKDTSYHLSGKKVVGLYFSAHWCGPCRQFTPFLSAVYDDMLEEHPEFELVFVSSDRDAASFQKYYEEIPFLALPFENRAAQQQLNLKYQVRGIPTLIFLNSQGEVITMDGRTVVAASRGDVDQLWSQLTN